MKTSVIFTTCPNDAEARSLARTLVEEKLVACAQIIPPCVSVYSWEGAVQESSEHLLILKTQKKLIARVETRVMELHSYDTPEFVALEAQHVAPQYKKWIKSVSNVE